MDLSIEEAAGIFTDPSAYADEPRFYAVCARLRRECPVAYVDVTGFLPFWALTRYDDIMEVERAPAVWVNAPRPALAQGAKVGTDRPDMPVRTLVQMDAPDHTVYRKISVEWFKQANVARLADRAAELAKRSVDHMADLGGECDFFTDVAMNYPLYIILALLGLPEEDFPRMLKLTQEMFGKDDPDMARQTEGDSLIANLLEFFEYFQGLIEDRRANPREDLASVIANAEVDGEPIGVLEAVGYYVIIATAGHDTTSAAISGGFAALLAHPDQLRRPDGRPCARADRGGGDVPLRVAGEAVHAHRDERAGPGRRDDSRGRFGADVVPCCEPRPGRLRQSRDVRRGARSEPAHRVRVRRPLLPRHAPRPSRDAGVLQRADPAARVRRAGRRPRVHEDDLRRRPQARPGSLPPPLMSAMNDLYRPKFLPDLLITALERNADRPAVHIEGEMRTAREMRDEISRYVQAFRAQGIELGSGVATLSKNRVEVLYSMGAVMVSGCRNTPLHPLGSLDDHAYVLEDAGIETLLFDPPFVDRARELRERVPGPPTTAVVRRSGHR